MVDFKLTTPVVFIIFNRPDTTERVFAEIAKAKPTRLLVVADGARTNKVGEAEKVAATRAIIERVDWECEVLTNYSDVNLGCKNRVSSGLDWVFQQVPEAIILEDDCLPHPSFFRFCQELLERYRHDERVMMIAGTNLASNPSEGQSYYFSRYPHIWGWASWRRAWESYDVSMGELAKFEQNKNYALSFNKNLEYRYWLRIFKTVYSGKIDTWDAQVVFMAFKMNAFTITPAVNLISNIGFGENATHTFHAGSQLAELPIDALNFPLNHPKFFVRDYEAENQRKSVEGIAVPMWKKVVSRLNLLRRFY